MGKRTSQNAPENRPADASEVDQLETELASLFAKHLGALPEPRQKDEWSIADLARDRHISPAYANAMANQLIADGKVTRRVIAKNQYLYRFT